jgi:septal ring factor EnvC (AmiA/AmiB activator)
MTLEAGWVSLLLLVGGLALQGLFWVFTQGQVAKDLAKLNDRFDDASDRSSRQMSEIQKKIGELELKHSEIDAHLIYVDRNITRLEQRRTVRSE